MQEFFPVAGFIAAYIAAKFTGHTALAMYWATAALMVCSAGQIIWMHINKQPIGKKYWLTAGIILFMGSATLLFRNPMIIKWKPTVSYLLFAALLLGMQWAGKGILVEKLLGQVFVMPKRMWVGLNIVWAGFFVLMAVANIIVAYGFSDDFWFGFKLWGSLGGMLVFILAQLWFLRAYLRKENSGGE